MDPLSSLLNGVRAEGSVVSQAVLRAPWTIRFADRAPLTMLTVLRGGGTLLLADGTERVVRQGDTAVVRGPEPFHLADRPGSIAGPHEQYEIACFVEDPECTSYQLGGIRWGNDRDGATALIVAAYRASGHRHERLLRALPRLLVVSEESDMCEWLETVAADAVARSAGAQALMDRLLDWALVCTLRTWFARAGAEAPEWIRGLSDPVVGPALEAVHARPGDGWTVASLAARAGVSRALFAKRFSAVMGRPPLTYVTEIRMDEAAALLLDTDLTVAQVARSVGYADAFGFSAAFKRLKGMSPNAFRNARLVATA
ncbi:AraC family transcriptional regulator [Nocardia sp. CDC159]|uniref:AraC family transcriptional regulator n=1 Tax=Nocardia pulmonis TaxID=2951408 RepID=A0A9X2IY73_9NOCA|nr:MULTISPECIES: AraC family transcriptional regulator [Nocardia]MCM6773606.1 AraC family transcriptional regulator [Nocardia pulmonis]MCM6786493.1 AraC family transcriptional regulator [Nocardia sp. CDC159]